VNTDLTTQMLTMRSAQTQHATQIAIVKKSHDMQTDLLNMLMETALSPPPPGQGAKVDKLA